MKLTVDDHGEGGTKYRVLDPRENVTFCRTLDEVVAVIKHKAGAPHRMQCPLCAVERKRRTR